MAKPSNFNLFFVGIGLRSQWMFNTYFLMEFGTVSMWVLAKTFYHVANFSKNFMTNMTLSAFFGL